MDSCAFPTCNLVCVAQASRTEILVQLSAGLWRWRKMLWTALPTPKPPLWCSNSHARCPRVAFWSSCTSYVEFPCTSTTLSIFHGSNWPLWTSPAQRSVIIVFRWWNRLRELQVFVLQICKQDCTKVWRQTWHTSVPSVASRVTTRLCRWFW